VTISYMKYIIPTILSRVVCEGLSSLRRNLLF
jgi:hypothetical protein